MMADHDVQLQKLKGNITNWREIILPISSVLLWDKPWHPCALMGGTSIVFMSIWLLDPSLLTTLSIIGLTVTISDSIVPLIASSMCKADTWSEKKDKQLDEICKMILKYYNILVNRAYSFCELRSNKPKLYYGATIISLVLLAWIGNNVNNLFLTYLFVVAMLLLPGMEYNGIITMYSKILTEKIGDMAHSAKIKVGQIKKD